MKIGIQLFLLRDKCIDKDSLFNAINSLSNMGYDGVEFFDYCGVKAGELREVIKDTGIEAINSHVSYTKWMENSDREIEYAINAGIKGLTFAWLPPELRNEEVYSWLKDNLPEIAHKCEIVGIKMYYHNHDFEFQKQNGEDYLLDRLLTNDNLVGLQLDTFWVEYAGLNPLEVINKYSKRLGPLHIKDYIEMKPKIKFCPIGSGKMGNIAIIEEAKKICLKWIVVDLDDSPIDTLETSRISIDYLKSQM